MGTPDYSVVIPAYNAGRTIGSCLDALLDQSVDKSLYEVIVVDDGSTDDTPDIIRQYPVRYIGQENAGPASARNRGAREARGKTILFTDSDCVPDRHWIEEMVFPLADDEISAVKGAYRTKQTSLTARFAQLEFEERFAMLERACHIDMVDTYSAAFRCEVFAGAGGFDESFPVANNEDTDLSYKLSLSGHRMVFNPRAFVYHLNHPDNPWKYMRLKFWRGYWRMVVYRRFPGKMVRDTYTPRTLKLQTVAVPGIALFLLLSLFYRPGLFPAAALAGFFLLTATPFVIAALSKDKAAGLVSPFFLLARGGAIGMGVAWFFFREMLKR